MSAAQALPEESIDVVYWRRAKETFIERLDFNRAAEARQYEREAIADDLRRAGICPECKRALS